MTTLSPPLSSRAIPCRDLRTFWKIGWLVLWLLGCGGVGRAGLIARWSFDAEDPWIVADSVGSLAGIRSVSGTRPEADGISGKALHFDGSGHGRVRIGDRLSLGDKPFTWVFWVRLKPGENQEPVVFLSRHAPGFEGGYYIGFDPVRRRLEAYAGARAETLFAVMLDDGKWHQLAVTYVPGGELRVYWNGMGPVASASGSKAMPSVAELVFGGFDGVEGWGEFTGSLDEIQVYGEALSERDLRLLHETSGRSLGEALAETVRIDPPGGTYTNRVAVTLTTLAATSVIRYTFDGTEPGAEASEYRGPLEVTNSVTIKARAYGTNGVPRSGSATATFEIRQVRHPASRLLAHWTFDQTGSDVAEEARGRYPGTLTPRGAEMEAGGVAGGALRIDAASAGAVNMGGVLPLGRTELTLAFWVRVPSNVAPFNGYVVSKVRPGGSSGYGLVWNTWSSQLLAHTHPGNSILASVSMRDGAWHHVAFTHSRRGEALLYVDGGSPVASGVLVDVVPGDAAFVVGSQDGGLGGNGFSGWIDDLQVYDVALSRREIEFLRQHPGTTATEPAPELAIMPDGGAFLDSVQVRLEAAMLDGVIRYTLDGREPTTDSPAYAGAFHLLESAVLKARVFAGDRAVSGTLERRFEVVPEPVGTRRLLGRWRFDEGTAERVANDETGWFPGQLQGVSTNGTRFVPDGVSGNAVRMVSRFEGKIDLGDAMALTNRAYSVSVWFRFDEANIPSDAVLFARHLNGSGTGYYVMLNTFRGPLTAYAGGSSHAVSYRKIDDGKWHHFVMTFGLEGLLRLYVDGEAASDPVVAGPVVPSEGSTFVGNLSNAQITPRFTGWIDELQAYDFELSEGQVGRLFARPGERLAVGMEPPPRLPAITKAPVGVTVEGGGMAEFSVAAEGTPPLAYQWYRDGVAIPGATGTNLVLPSVSAIRAGAYQVRVSNRWATTASDEVPLRVVVPTPGPGASLVAHWKCDEGGSYVVEETGWYPGIIVNQASAFIAGGIAGNALTFDRSGGGFAEIHSSFALPVGAFTVSLWYRYPTVPPDQDVILFSHHDPATGAGTVLGVEARTGRLHAIRGTTAQVSLASTNLLDRRWHHVLLSRAPNGDLRLHLDGAAPAVGVDSVFSLPSQARTYLGARHASGPLPGRTIPAFDGALDDLQVYDFAVTDEMVARLIREPGTALPAVVRPPPVRPSILEKSSDILVESGGKAVLQVVASGSSPLWYQWYFKDVAITGANSPEYVIESVTPATEGVYSVQVSNVAGMERSTPIRVRIPDPLQVPPEFLLLPVWRTVQLGDPVAFSSVAIGSAPLGYQWYHDGIPISGADQSVFLIPKVDDLRMAGNYWVVVTNLFGSVRSPGVTLDIHSAQGTRSIRFLGPDRVREGDVARVEIRFVIDARYQAKTFFLRYSNRLLGYPRLQWASVVDAARSYWNSRVETPAFGDTLEFLVVGHDLGIPAGDHLIATLEFPVLAPDGEETARIEFMPLDPIVDPYPAGVGWTAFPTEFGVLPRRMKGDENGNLRLDIGDAVSMLERLRLPAQIPSGVVRANDLDGSGGFDLADAARALRILLRRDPSPPLGPAMPGEIGPKAPEPKGPMATLTLDPARSPANRVRATVRWADGTRPRWGASFTLRFDPAVFRLRSTLDLSVGASVPPDALVAWNMPTNEVGTVHFVAGSGVAWTASSDVLATLDFDVLSGIEEGRAAVFRLESLELARSPREIPESSLPVEAIFNAPPESRPSLTVGRSPDGATWVFRLEGVPGRRYVIESSANLIDWQPLPDAVSAGDGPVAFRQGPEVGSSRAFFRARSAP